MTAGLRKAPTFDMFSPSYIKDLESFTVRMPTTYVHILLQSRPFSAGDVIKFLLEPARRSSRKLSRLLRLTRKDRALRGHV